MTGIRADLVRGGTSRGVFVHLDDLPTGRAERDRLVLALLGTPDPMQVDGLGGGHSSTSKLVAVRASTAPGADLDYLFLQVGIDEPVVDDSGNCGNLSYAVGPWGIERGLAAPGAVRLRNLNTGRILVSTARPGPGPGPYPTGTSVDVDHLDPAGADGRHALPTGSAVDHWRWRRGTLPVTVADVTSPVLMVRAEDLGRTGHESRAALAADTELLADLERVRAELAAELGHTGPGGPSRAVPRIAILAGPRSSDRDVETRSVSLQRVHHAVPGTSAMCVAAASRIAGTVACDVAGGVTGPGPATVRVGHLRGVLEVRTDAHGAAAGRRIGSVGVTGTARTLLTGTAQVPHGEERP
ncbi:PrpF domain-containing protein [Pseudonocardia sp. HH130630-07]|uniref:PrpF domain-containing protein n=1 Tax=Pseudonocardia sp. HH130630-07 TaxID=1690815 RepID=UPI000814E472|nr:PrpF domain-containing protein [Pseudonocardia sp. HH130630-07]ANY06142.1 hypothetical protein AFB00_07330 [Pseudonocardia sp. HH130630-07]